ncbi:flagellar biosynthetic protein FliO [Sporolactobacillus nakayamae]|uniref:Flagellar protein FliO/FliZ n=1 Tax=Sporolactobacillus nakayamae TaxID=269670 RepID=A0A1I2NCE9_9BACL|nr:flagellar biosynthetic protein FliO [Sporolactobacillus nakayamae]SFG01554.1 flagellar protein FliO/FliZ [Sporolactobacillus nakayamae]
MKRTHWFKLALAFCLILFFLIDPISISHAESEDNTVKEWIENGQKTQKTDNQPTSNSTSTQKTKSVNYGNSNLFVTFIKLFFALLIVLALIYLLYHFVVKRTGKFTQVHSLKNMGGVSLGANRSLQLIRVGDEVLVVGVGETVQLLKEIKDPDVIQSLTRHSDSPDPFEENVLKALKWTTDHALRRSKSTTDGQDRTTPVQNEFQKQLDVLNKERSNQLSALIQEVRKK